MTRSDYSDPALADEASAIELSAYMDGELSPERTRFLQRRLEHDPALRARWQRWQLAAACLRGQAITLIAPDTSARIAEALATEPAISATSAAASRWGHWAIAAALVLAVALAPRLGSENTDHAVAQHAAVADIHVADGIEVPAAVSLPSAESWSQSNRSALAISPAPAAAQAALPLPEKSKPWPRSPLIGRDDAGLEGYLVRHNGLLAEDGMAGLLPQVDVLAHDVVTLPASEAERP